MSNFKPSLSYKTEQSIRDCRNGYRKHESINEYFTSYRLLKKKLREIAKTETPIDDIIHVSRSKRGEWGEWFENWIVSNGKTRIIKQGWM